MVSNITSEALTNVGRNEWSLVKIHERIYQSLVERDCTEELNMTSNSSAFMGDNAALDIVNVISLLKSLVLGYMTLLLLKVIYYCYLNNNAH